MNTINSLHEYLERLVKTQKVSIIYCPKGNDYLIFGDWKTQTFLTVSNEEDGNFIAFIDDTQTNKAVAVENPTVATMKAMIADPFGYLEAHGEELSDLLKYPSPYIEEEDTSDWGNG